MKKLEFIDKRLGIAGEPLKFGFSLVVTFAYTKKPYTEENVIHREWADRQGKTRTYSGRAENYGGQTLSDG